MAQATAKPEPALWWSLFYALGAMGLLFAAPYVGEDWNSPVWLEPALWTGAAAYAALFVGVAGAMGEPLPRLAGARVPARLRLCWGVLGLTPPPTRTARFLPAGAAAALVLYPFRDFGAASAAAAAFFAGGALAMGKSRTVEDADLFETVFIAAGGFLGVAALFMAGSGGRAEAVRGVAAVLLIAAATASRAREVVAVRWKQVLPGLPPPPALDLSRWQVAVEREAAPLAEALPPGVEERLVDTGSFRVDPAKMIEKLRERQMADPRDFILAWLRCAGASRAGSIALNWDARSLSLSFDGEPFTAAQLAQPYQALVDGEGDESGRGRHFAYGLLAVYRLRPKGISVVSSGPAGRAAMNVGDAAPAPAERGTVIRVAWPAWAWGWRPFLVASRAVRRWGLSRVPLTLNGDRVPDRPGGEEWLEFRHGAFHGLRRTATGDGEVRLYVLGTLVETTAEVQGRRVEGWLAADRSALDISQTKVVRDDAFERAFSAFCRVPR